MAGKFFDEWQVGDRIEHDIRRTVTETDNLLFSTMTHNPQPLHLDIEAAPNRIVALRQILVNSTFTFALLVGLSVGDTTLGTLVAESGVRQGGNAKACFYRRYDACAERGEGAERKQSLSS